MSFNSLEGQLLRQKGIFLLLASHLFWRLVYLFIYVLAKSI